MKFNSPDEFIEKLNNWFNGLIALPLVAVGYGYLEIFTGGLQGITEIDTYINLFIIGILLAYAVVVTRTYKIKIKDINGDGTLFSKLETYFIISKSFYIKIFSISLITVLGLYISGSIAYAGSYAFLLFLLSIYRPSLLTVATKLGMKGEERKAFVKNSKTIIT